MTCIVYDDRRAHLEYVVEPEDVAHAVEGEHKLDDLPECDGLGDESGRTHPERSHVVVTVQDVSFYGLGHFGGPNWSCCSAPTLYLSLYFSGTCSVFR